MAGADARLAELEADLDRAQRGLGLPDAGGVPEAARLMAVTAAELRSMSAEACCEAALVLGRLAFEVQRLGNRRQAVATFCEENVRHLVADVIPGTPGYSPEERRTLAVKRHATAARLAALKARAEAAAADLAFLAPRAERQARLFELYARLKARRDG